jgi:hypothetical protein
MGHFSALVRKLKSRSRPSVEERLAPASSAPSAPLVRVAQSSPSTRSRNGNDETERAASSSLISVRQDVLHDLSGQLPNMETSLVLCKEPQPGTRDANLGDSGMQVVSFKEKSFQSPNEDLWDIAYENLRESQKRLILEYEKALAKESASKATSTFNFDNAKGLGRETQMADLVKERLKAIDDSKWRLKVGSKTVVIQEQIDRLVKVVTLAKDFFSSIVASTPQGAIAWAGVCVLLPVCVEMLLNAFMWNRHPDKVLVIDQSYRRNKVQH